MSPFGSISLRETALAGHRPHLLGLPRKSGRGISLRETTLCGCPLRGHGFATPHRYFAVPVTAAPRRGPNGKTPALVAVRLHFACAKPRGRTFPPPGATCSLPHFRFAQMWPRIFPRGLPGYVPLFHGWPRARTPALVAVRLHFAYAKPRGRSLPPPGATCSLPHFRFAQMWPRIFPRGLPGYVPLFHGWPRARTPALVAVRLHFAARNRAGRSLPPPGATCSLPHFRFAQMWPRARTPALVAVRLHFAARNRAGRSLPPPGATCSLPHFRFAQMRPRIFPRGLPGYVPLFHGWPRARTPALVAVRLHFAARNRAGRSLPPPGATCSLPHFRFAQMWPRARTPALSSVSS